MNDILEKTKILMDEKVAATDFEGTVKFDIEDVGVLRVTAQGATLEDGEADVIVTANIETLKDLFKGKLSPTSAFVSGRVGIEGDMGIAVRLGSLFG